MISLLSLPSTPENTNGCCDGYQWDALKNDCVECISGYTGIGCTLTCRYPLYGKNCQQVCKCSRMECNFEFGCRSGEALSTRGYVKAARFISQRYVESHLSVLHKI
uniref:Uncharacterized protein n=1 Tax=Magallana gigas TaxID=29159 RepID=K1Q4F8_MAGGI